MRDLFIRLAWQRREQKLAMALHGKRLIRELSAQIQERNGARIGITARMDSQSASAERRKA